MKRLLVFCSLLGLAFVVPTEALQPCFSFRRGEQIYRQCEGTERLVFQRHGLYNYAIDQNTMAITVRHFIQQNGRLIVTGADDVILLRGATENHVKLPASAMTLYASCGTILTGLNDAQQSTWDVVAAKPVEFTDLRRPACNTDKTLVVGMNQKRDLVTQTGEILALANTFGSYAVSPGGQAVAYIMESSQQVCIKPVSEPSICYHANPFNSGGISVDDNGQALFVEGISQTCYFASGRVSEKKFPGGGADQCYASAVVTTSSAPRVLAILGYLPSWTPEIPPVHLLNH